MKPLLLKKSLLLGSSGLFLVGCSGWTGLLPDRYDGQALQREEEAIRAYAENQEIIGEGKDLYLLQPFSEELLLPSLPLVEDQSQDMRSGKYTAGKDFPEGRYQFWYPAEVTADPMQLSNAALTVTDAEGSLILEELLTPMGMPVEINLREGNEVTITGENAQVKMGSGASDLMTPEEGGILLSAGIWEAGEHVPAGTYVITDQPSNGYLYVFEQTAEPRVIEFNSHMEIDPETGEATSASPDLEVTFEEGQSFYLAGTDRMVRLEPKDTLDE